MVTFKKTHNRYQKYIPTNVDWIGDIPDGWEVRKLKYVSKTSFQYWANEAGLDDNQNNPRFIRITDIDEKWNLRLDTFKSLESDVAKDFLLNDWDILFARSGATVGKTFQYRTDWWVCCYAGYLIRMNVDSKRALSDFIYYITKSAIYESWKDSIFIKATIQNISAEKYKGFYIALPPLGEQERIVDYLDEKTSFLDEAIVKKQRQIELLSEHRTALINNAITKGLDLNAEMKDSGVDWIWIIPKGWEVKKLKNGFSFEKGKNAGIYTQEYISADKNKWAFPVYSGQTENGGVMGYVNSFIYDEERAIFTTTVGAKVMTPMLLSWKFSLSQNCVLFKKTTSNIDERYFYYQLFPLFKRQKDDIPSHMQPSLRIGDLNRYVVAFPPFEEQKQIADYLDKELAYIDSMKKKIEQSIELLQEYKVSLISHAVSGKIKIS